MENLIQKYLVDNGLTGTNGKDYDFRIDENGDYYIDRWNYQISKPIFTTEDIDTINLILYKKLKIIELKNKRDQWKKDNGYYSENNYIISNILNGIGNYSQDDVDNCRTFVNNLVLTYDSYKTQIENVISISELESIVINFNN